MEQTDIIAIMSDGIYTILIVAAPMLLIGLVVGVIISIFQATTQINEQTLAFIPKIVAIFLALLLFGGFMLGTLTDFFHRVFDYIATLN